MSINKKIEMRQFNGTDYDVLYPATTIEQVDGLNTILNGKYTKPSNGIPKTDLASGIQTSLDLADSAMSASNPIGTGSFSMNRRSSTTVGTNSVTEGSNCKASGSNSHAEGTECDAEDIASHAEGEYCEAHGEASHAEGYATHAIAECSHAEGYVTYANSCAQHAQGMWNYPDNNDVYADIVGNGHGDGDDVVQSNAFALTWTGTGKYAGDLYTGCNADSTGGNKVATESWVGSQGYLTQHQSLSAYRTASAQDSIDVGKVAVSQGVAKAGQFLVVGVDGNVTTQTLQVWQGGSY